MKKLSLRWKVLIPVLVGILILGVTIFFVAQQIIQEQAERMAINKVRSDISLMYELIDRDFPGEWRKDGLLLYKGEAKLNDNNELVDRLARLTGNTVTIFRDDTRVATSVRVDGERATGTKAAANVIEQVLVGKEHYYGSADVVGQTYQTAYRPLLSAEGDAVGMLYTGASPTIITETVESFRGSIMLTTAVVSFLVGAVLFILLTKGVLSPIAVVCKQATAIARGDLRVEIPQAYTERGDEIGVLTRAFKELTAGLREIIDTLQTMTSRARQTGEQLSAASQENTASIEEVASFVNEFSEMVSNVNRQGERMSRGAQTVKELAATGQTEMDGTARAMDRIAEGAQGTKEAISHVAQEAEKMGLVLNLISEVAEQTNLLALNAAIEAARAGEQGRGFAVVADQVRQLAEETKEAVTEIASMNQALMSQVNRAVETIDLSEQEVGAGQKVLQESMQGFQTIVQHIDDMVTSINQVAASSGEMDATSQQLSAVSEEQAASMVEIANMAEDVASMVADLQKLIARFLV